jgi:hypothetical protein
MGMEWITGKFQISSTKSQINSKFQIPMTQTKSPGAFYLRFGHWSLVLIWNLGFAIWNFSLCSGLIHQTPDAKNAVVYAN